MSSLLRATSPVSFPHSSPLVLLISHVKEDRIKSPSSINTSQPCISDQCLPVCRIIHYYTLHYGLIILAMVYSMAPSSSFNVACTIIIQTIYLATTVYLALYYLQMPCCHDNHNTVIELAMQRRAAFSGPAKKPCGHSGQVRFARPMLCICLVASEASFLVCSMRGFYIYLYIYIFIYIYIYIYISGRTSCRK